MVVERQHETEQLARDALLERAARRDYWIDMGRTLLQLLFWVAAGLACMGAALHSTNAATGRMLWLAGQTVWMGGVLFTLLAAWRRGGRRGDW